ncbi:MAG: cation:proton antiporter subunit C [Planctomycetota bacterium]
MSDLLGLLNYWIYVVLMMVGLYAAIAKDNLVKKLLGLSLFQTGIFIFYISTSVIDVGGGLIATAPIHGPGVGTLANPLPHVLILTAIVVSVSTMAVALAIVVNIKREFGTIESDELHELEGPEGIHSPQGSRERASARDPVRQRTGDA